MHTSIQYLECAVHYAWTIIQLHENANYNSCNQLPTYILQLPTFICSEKNYLQGSMYPLGFLYSNMCTTFFDHYLCKWNTFKYLHNLPFQSDNGAPLMCLDNEGSWKLMGIQSKEGECLTKSHPDVFTSISVLNDWISKSIS